MKPPVADGEGDSVGESSSDRAGMVCRWDARGRGVLVVMSGARRDLMREAVAIVRTAGGCSGSGTTGV